ncbi:WecB/TagA/CpsF family glycosyltransferase [Castellaniella defragrans]|uniref:WecB/TagA/CpsF family glycosyltransferase n=1 Tax=Castellaniella defragrans TaxID=75697 RepID=UPI002AFFB3CB|nr:WecB/TagA/CpsF family glycosyltransferase [Castellaniella defragrans]
MPRDPLPEIPTRPLFGLEIMAARFDEAVRAISRACRQADAGAARVVVTPNTDHIVKLERRPGFKQDYARADFIFADGMPLVWAGRLLGQPLPERVTGADLFPALCRQAVAERWRVMLIGGQPGAEAALAAGFQRHFPGLDIRIVSPSMRFDPLGEEGREIACQVRGRAPHLVFVCLGLPKQEQWALHHAPTLPGGVLLCVGAAMEFALGLKPRAPLWMRRLGLEWLWRLLSDPAHLWRRYLVDDPYFLVICWRQWRRLRAGRRRDP